MTAPLLEIQQLSRRFRGLRAVSNVSFSVPQGTIVALVGPNGAGKTTVFNLVAGSLKPDGGRILLDGRAIAGQAPHRVCAAGIARTFQLVRPFPGLTVLENTVVGALLRHRKRADAETAALAVLSRLSLTPLAHRMASSLTLPDRKRLEIARALATGPRLLLLDEVLAGLRPTEVDQMIVVLQALNREEGLTILLVEHVMRAVMALADHVVVLHHGEMIAEGTPAQVTQDAEVIACYLGTDTAWTTGKHAEGGRC